MYPCKDIRDQIQAIARVFSNSSILVSKSIDPWPHFLGPNSILLDQFSNTSYLCEGNRYAPFFLEEVDDLDISIPYLIYIKVDENETSFSVSFRELEVRRERGASDEE